MQKVRQTVLMQTRKKVGIMSDSFLDEFLWQLFGSSEMDFSKMNKISNKLFT